MIYFTKHLGFFLTFAISYQAAVFTCNFTCDMNNYHMCRTMYRIKSQMLS